MHCDHTLHFSLLYGFMVSFSAELPVFGAVTDSCGMEIQCLMLLTAVLFTDSRSYVSSVVIVDHSVCVCGYYTNPLTVN